MAFLEGPAWQEGGGQATFSSDEAQPQRAWKNSIESYFWGLLEDRYAQCRPMVWASNCSLEELEAMLSQNRAKPIVGRLSEFSNIAEI